MSSLKVWIDGKLFDKADAKVSVYDHGLLYGDGVFEGIRVYNGKIFEWEAHVRRLFDSAKAIRLKIPHGPQQLREATEQTFRANFIRENYVALGVSYIIYSQSIWSVERAGEGWRGMSNRGSATANHYDHVHVTVAP